MNRSILRTIFFVATLMISSAAVAEGQDDGVCSNVGVAGNWGWGS